MGQWQEGCSQGLLPQVQELDNRKEAQEAEEEQQQEEQQQEEQQQEEQQQEVTERQEA